MYIFHIFTHIFTYSSCPEACIDSIVIILCPDIDGEAVFGGGGSLCLGVKVVGSIPALVFLCRFSTGALVFLPCNKSMHILLNGNSNLHICDS